jgi:hypothetical protein
VNKTQKKIGQSFIEAFRKCPTCDGARRTRYVGLSFDSPPIDGIHPHTFMVCEGAADALRRFVSVFDKADELRPVVIIRVHPKPELIAMADAIGETRQ